MEKWKIGVIAVLLLGLVGYGISQQQTEKPNSVMFSTTPTVPGATASRENKAADYISRQLGSDKLPEWTSVGPWTNTKTPVTLGAIKGKATLIEFFSVDCSHCQEATPFMEALYKRYQMRGLKMVAIQSPIHPKVLAGDETQWPKVQNFVKAAGLTYPVGMDKDSKYFQQTLKGENYPTTMIADKSGVIVHADTGYDAEKAIALSAELEKQLPGKGTPKERAADLAKFLRPFIFSNGAINPTIYKALTDDIEQRLMGKV